MKRLVRGVAYELDDMYFPGPMPGQAGYCSNETDAGPPTILIPDRERGGYKEHAAAPTPRKLGFR